MAKNSNEFKYKFSDGRVIRFGIRDGQVKKICRTFFPEKDFYEALQAARKYLLPPRPKTVWTVQKRLSPNEKRMLAEAAANEARLRAMLPDY